MKKRALIIVALLLLEGCNTTGSMVVPVLKQPDLYTIDTPVDKQPSFALSKVIANIKRGTVIAKFLGQGVEGV